MGGSLVSGSSVIISECDCVTRGQLRLRAGLVSDAEQLQGNPTILAVIALQYKIYNIK